ncbi:hypothetical protein DPMN_085639 [Dreissena polymorpha]|uniref:Uncharacterized protein n=1 Tax=Dreissena polymorpha TaxID=45954 RepID=A0A9D3YD22_DREPO|nr:hypothetical protein DPMN_085639 [Dreissena polymorpha]
MVLTVLLFSLSEADRRNFQQGKEEREEESDVLIELEELVEVDSVGFNLEITRKYEHSGPTREVEDDPISEIEQIQIPSYPGQDQLVDGSQETGTGGTVLEAWDSHFYIDRTSQKLFGHQAASLENILTADVGVIPKVKVQVVGGVMVYCDPESYPTSIRRQKKGFGAAVGIHPKKVQFFPQSKFEELRNLLRLKTVVALGEIGLDRCAPNPLGNYKRRS